MTTDRLAALLRDAMRASHEPDAGQIVDWHEWIAARLAAAGVTVAPQPAPSGVHNHGTEDGPGIACREYRIGACRLIPQPATRTCPHDCGHEWWTVGDDSYDCNHDPTV